jgi:hypothetical protein
VAARDVAATGPALRRDAGPPPYGGPRRPPLRYRNRRAPAERTSRSRRPARHWSARSPHLPTAHLGRPSPPDNGPLAGRRTASAWRPGGDPAARPQLERTLRYTPIPPSAERDRLAQRRPELLTGVVQRHVTWHHHRVRGLQNPQVMLGDHGISRRRCHRPGGGRAHGKAVARCLYAVPEKLAPGWPDQRAPPPAMRARPRYAQAKAYDVALLCQVRDAAVPPPQVSTAAPRARTIRERSRGLPAVATVVVSKT